ncbi:hypothetical protein N7495_008372 [Penicillium taxi]|uniref:uncharacterized protein n=1 Tax=Penicillium taxi TaxID=168475 RepID=UPI002545116F|nr:uncharacterized protein N7495_008372 [Penicillium taxi]KAJ5888331.1 hypothetical protein N7495_008372 [Penicillium taxi]
MHYQVQVALFIGEGLNQWHVTHVSKASRMPAVVNPNNEPIHFADFCFAIRAYFGHYPPFQGTCARITGLSSVCKMQLLVDKPTVIKSNRILGYEARIRTEEAIRLICARKQRL